MVILVRFVCQHLSWCWLSVSRSKNRFPPGIGEGRRNTFTKGNLWLAFSKKAFFFHLHLLNCLQLKIILMPKRHILRWHIVIFWSPTISYITFELFPSMSLIRTDEAPSFNIKFEQYAVYGTKNTSISRAKILAYPPFSFFLFLIDWLIDCYVGSSFLC